MFAKFRLLVFLISILGLSLSSCQKETLYTPGGPEAIENLDTNASSDTISNLPEGNYNEIIDPDDEDDEDRDDRIIRY